MGATLTERIENGMHFTIYFSSKGDPERRIIKPDIVAPGIQRSAKSLSSEDCGSNCNDHDGVCEIQGATTAENEMNPGSRLNTEDLQKLEDVIKIINATNEAGLNDKVTSIDITDKSEYSIYLAEDKKQVHLGDASNLSNKMLYVVAILEDEQGKEGDIYVNGDLNNKFNPYFREKV